MATGLPWTCKERLCAICAVPVACRKVNLADMIGVSQSCISKWESAQEPPSLRAKKRLIDVLLNRSGLLNPLIQNLVKYDPAVAVFDVHAGLVHVPAMLAQTGRLESSCIDIMEYSSKFVGDWRADACHQTGPSETLLMETEHEFSGHSMDGHTTQYRARTLIYSLQLEAQRPLMLSRWQLLPSSGAPGKLMRAVTVESMESESGIAA